jgi:hypothetical protein
MEIKQEAFQWTNKGTMEHKDYWIAGIFGAIGGTGKILLQINSTEPALLKIMGALIMAFACGLVGAAGKYAFDGIRKYASPAVKLLLSNIKKIANKIK